MLGFNLVVWDVFPHGAVYWMWAWPFAGKLTCLFVSVATSQEVCHAHGVPIIETIFCFKSIRLRMNKLLHLAAYTPTKSLLQVKCRSHAFVGQDLGVTM